MRASIFFASVFFAAPSVFAQQSSPPPPPPAIEPAPAPLPERPAARYSDRSLSLLGGGQIAQHLGAGSLSTSWTSVWLDGEVRMLWRGWALVPRLGARVGWQNITAGSSSASSVAVGVRPGLLIGTIRPVSERMSVGVLAGYVLEASSTLASGGELRSLSHSATLEVPLTVHFSRNGFVEPMAQVSYTHAQSTPSSGLVGAGSYVHALVGVRFGYTL